MKSTEKSYLVKYMKQKKQDERKAEVKKALEARAEKWDEKKKEYPEIGENGEKYARKAPTPRSISRVLG